MALILSIETATKVCSVALHYKGKRIAMQEIWVAQSHAASLMLMIRHMLAIHGYTGNDLSAIAIASGPGSYTGLRIGTATAQGLCYAWDIPLIAINTLEAMAHAMNPYNITQAVLCPMIDARRMEVYCMLCNAKLQVVAPIQSKVIDSESFQDWLKTHALLFFGDGMEKCKPILSKNSKAAFVENIYPSAVNLGPLAYAKFQKEAFEDVAYFEPLYKKALA